MSRRPTDPSPRALARLGGALYLIIIVLGIFEEAFVRDRLVVSGNAPPRRQRSMTHASASTIQ